MGHVVKVARGTPHVHRLTKGCINVLCDDIARFGMTRIPEDLKNYCHLLRSDQGAVDLD
jgi:hypothetical protein